MSIIRFTKKIENTTPTIKKQRQFGVMKGLVSYMAADFNAPIDDFNEYM